MRCGGNERIDPIAQPDRGPQTRRRTVDPVQRSPVDRCADQPSRSEIDNGSRVVLPGDGSRVRTSLGIRVKRASCGRKDQPRHGDHEREREPGFRRQRLRGCLTEPRKVKATTPQTSHAATPSPPRCQRVRPCTAALHPVVKQIRDHRHGGGRPVPGGDTCLFKPRGCEGPPDRRHDLFRESGGHATQAGPHHPAGRGSDRRVGCPPLHAWSDSDGEQDRRRLGAWQGDDEQVRDQRGGDHAPVSGHRADLSRTRRSATS